MEKFKFVDKDISISRLKSMYSLIYAGLLIFILLGSFYVIYEINERNNKKELAEEHFSQLDIIENEIMTHLELAIVPINLFDSGEMVNAFFVDPGGEMCSPFMLYFENFIKNYNQFNQLRFLDIYGQEILRADNMNGNPKIVEIENLQNKGERYYFTDTMKLETDTIYVSRFDLNVENGQVEEPYRPMIRIAKKIVDGDNQTLGIVIVNYEGQVLLDSISDFRLHEGDELYIVNEEGYNLYSPQKSTDFAFMFEDKKDLGFFSEYPEIWTQVQDGEVEILTSKGIFYVRSMTLLSDDLGKNTSETIKLIVKIPPERVISKSRGLFTSLAYASVVFIPLFIFIGIQLGLARANRKWYQNELLRNASLDALTGLYNRRTILDYLKHYIDQYERTSMDITVAFIDINNLKKVNDEYGHEKGDEMIVSFSDVIKSNFRKTDLLSRIGGDEFLIVFINSSEDGCIQAVENAFEAFAEAGIRNIGFPYEFSYGVTSYQEGDTMDELVDRADNLMYIDKRKKKNINE